MKLRDPKIIVKMRYYFLYAIRKVSRAKMHY